MAMRPGGQIPCETECPATLAIGMPAFAILNSVQARAVGAAAL